MHLIRVTKRQKFKKGKDQKESLLFWCQGSFAMFSFQHPQVSLHPACVAGWTASLQPCSVQSATLLQSQIWTQLPYTLDQAPMFTRLLLHCCWSGSNNPASQFPGWEGGVSVGEVQLQWNGLKAGPNSATWRRSRRIRACKTRQVYTLSRSLNTSLTLSACILGPPKQGLHLFWSSSGIYIYTHSYWDSLEIWHWMVHFPTKKGVNFCLQSKRGGSEGVLGLGHHFSCIYLVW